MHLSTSESPNKSESFSLTRLFGILSVFIRFISIDVCFSLVGRRALLRYRVELEHRINALSRYENGLCGACTWLYIAIALNITYSAIFLLCKYGNRFSVCACNGLCNKLAAAHSVSCSCSFSCSISLALALFLLLSVFSDSCVRFSALSPVFVSFSFIHTFAHTHTRKSLACLLLLLFSVGFGESSSSLIGLTYTTLHCIATTVSVAVTASAGAHSFIHA